MKKKDSILVVDDDMDFLNLVYVILREEGYAVDTARTGTEALEKCREEFYSLLLLDIKLPDFDGIQIIKLIDDTDPRMRKVIITGYPTVENARQALNLGADAYLIKPLKPEALLETIRQQLKELEKEFNDKYITLKGPKPE